MENDVNISDIKIYDLNNNTLYGKNYMEIAKKLVSMLDSSNKHYWFFYETKINEAIESFPFRAKRVLEAYYNINYEEFKFKNLCNKLDCTEQTIFYFHDLYLKKLLLFMNSSTSKLNNQYIINEQFLFNSPYVSDEEKEELSKMDFNDCDSIYFVRSLIDRIKNEECFDNYFYEEEEDEKLSLELFNIPLKDTKISSRTQNLLEKNGIYSLGAMTHYSIKELKKFGGLGNGCLNEILNVSDEFGFSFKANNLENKDSLRKLSDLLKEHNALTYQLSDVDNMIEIINSSKQKVK